MKPNETRRIPINGVTCKFKIYDDFIVVFPGVNQYEKLVETIRNEENNVEQAITRLRERATKAWSDILIYSLTCK